MEPSSLVALVNSEVVESLRPDEREDADEIFATRVYPHVEQFSAQGGALDPVETVD
jgi:hypothetical protein